LIFEVSPAKLLCFAGSLAALNSPTGRMRQATQFIWRKKRGIGFALKVKLIHSLTYYLPRLVKEQERK
jgi:hypothetical protein